jgi:hypothetical protein
MEVWVRDQVHRDFIEVDIQNPFKPHRASEVAQQVGYDVVHLVVCLLFLDFWKSYLIGWLFGATFLAVHLGFENFSFVDDVDQSLVVDWEHAVGMLHELVEGEHRVVWRGHHIIVLRREYRSSEPKYIWIVVFKY